jgi:PPM family protein phosphatase
VAVAVIEEVGLTDVGRQRQSNEDSFVEAPPLFAVADGMGGARAGEVASRMAVEAFADSGGVGDEPEARLAEIARAANRRIYELARSDPGSYRGMGTTLTAAMVHGREIAIGHVGDSRLYRLRDGKLDRLTTDHSLVEEYVKAGRLAPEDAESHPQKSIITRALGVEEDVEVDTLTCDASDGDVYLLCSDGLTSMVSEEDVAEVIRSAPSLEQAGRTLIDAANQAGGRDNITVVLFRVSESDSLPSDDGDTLSGADTQTGLHASDVQTALAAAEAGDGGGAPADRPREPATAGAGRRGETLVLDAESAEAARAEARAGDRRERRERRPGRSRRRRRTALSLLAGLLVILAVAGGLLLASRQVYFVGTSDAGMVALYRGLPYELPFELELYEEVYETTLPASRLPPPQRRAALNQELRSRSDAVDLVRQLEQGRTITLGGGGP